MDNIITGNNKCWEALQKVTDGGKSPLGSALNLTRAQLKIATSKAKTKDFSMEDKADNKELIAQLCNRVLSDQLSETDQLLGLTTWFQRQRSFLKLISSGSCLSEEYRNKLEIIEKTLCSLPKSESTPQNSAKPQESGVLFNN